MIKSLNDFYRFRDDIFGTLIPAFAILAVALGVSVIAGIAITDDSLGEGFGTFFSLNLGRSNTD